MEKMRKLRESRTGAALLMVLLVMVFVVIMGSSVMFTSYNSYMMRLVERAGADTFYSTEELTDLVRVTVQEAASESLETAYTRVMAEYAFIQADCLYDDEAVQEAAQSKFNQYFIEELSKVTVPSADGSGKVHLFQLDEPDELATQLDPTNTNTPIISGSYSTSSLGNSLPSDKINGDASVSGMSGYTSTNGTVGALTGVHFDDGTLENDGTYDSSSAGVPSAGHFYYTYGDDGYPRLVLEYVTVGYETGGTGNSAGYTTNITTDIIIEMPIFTHTGDTHIGYGGSSGGTSNEAVDAIPFDNAASIGRFWVKHSMPKATMIADGKMHVTDEYLVTGDLFGGAFYIYTSNPESGGTVDPTGVEFSHGDGRLITSNGPIYSDEGQDKYNDHYHTSSSLTDASELDGIGVYGGTSLITQPTSEIWTNTISVFDGGDLSLGGVTYFKKNIDISGGAYENDPFQVANNPSNISLGGTLIGFGNGTTAETSSIIAINGDYVTMDMSRLNSVTLGGSAYLEIGRTIETFDDEKLATYSDYRLGQSIAAAPDALAYLVPTKALKPTGATITSNPMMYEGTAANSAFDVSIDLSHSSLPLDNMSTYVKGSPTTISRVYNLGGTIYTLVYYFYDFHSDALCNEYLAKYGTLGAFQNNLELFVDFAETDTALTSADTAGVFYYMDGEGSLQMVNNGTMSNEFFEDYQEQFDNVAITLWPNNPPNFNINYNIYDHLGLNGTTQGNKWTEDYADWDVDNPFDYYVNMHGDNVEVNMAFSGKNDMFDPTNAVEDQSIWDYFAPAGTTTVDGTNFREGLEDWATKDTSQDIYEFVLDGKVKAIFTQVGSGYGSGGVGGTYIDPALYPDLEMIISRSGVDLYQPFKGLVFSETGIALMAPINSQEVGESFVDFMHATCTIKYNVTEGGLTREVEEYRYLYEFFRNLNMQLVTEDEEEGSDPLLPGVSEDDAKVNWKPNDLVYYENWEKH